MPKLTKHDRASADTASLASLYVIGMLTEDERSDFERHLEEGCAICNSEVESASAALGALAGSAGSPQPSGMRERFQARLNKEESVMKDSTDHGILLREAGVVISRTESMQWRPGPFPGVWIKPLYLDQQQQRATSLVRMDPGTRYPSHRHNSAEEVFLLDGDFVVEGQVMRPGDYCHAQPASVHLESYTNAGCMFIISASQSDEILTQP
jgi:anti-sigma factor ChrR (cupin superfamily)